MKNLSGKPGHFLPHLYEELKNTAGIFLSKERAGHTLQPTALIHEAYLRLARGKLPEIESETHFRALATETMRRVLVDHARKRDAKKRGGERARILLDEEMTLAEERELDLIALHQSLERLASLDPQQARIVELRFFGGLKEEEIAQIIEISLRTVQGKWRMARAWLRQDLQKEHARGI